MRGLSRDTLYGYALDSVAGGGAKPQAAEGNHRRVLQVACVLGRYEIEKPRGWFRSPNGHPEERQRRGISGQRNVSPSRDSSGRKTSLGMTATPTGGTPFCPIPTRLPPVPPLASSAPWRSIFPAPNTQSPRPADPLYSGHETGQPESVRSGPRRDRRNGLSPPLPTPPSTASWGGCPWSRSSAGRTSARAACSMRWSASGSASCRTCPASRATASPCRCSIDDRYVELVDTGGYGFVDPDQLTEHIKHQIELAMTQAQPGAVRRRLPGRADRRRSRRSRRCCGARGSRRCWSPTRPTAPTPTSMLGDFARLGLGTPIGVSALNDRNIDQVIDAIAKNVDLSNAPTEMPEPQMLVAIVGKRNAGKSTLVNAIAEIYEGARRPRDRLAKCPAPRATASTCASRRRARRWSSSTRPACARSGTW